MPDLKWLDVAPCIVAVERDGQWFWEARTPAGREALAWMARLPTNIRSLEDPDADPEPEGT